MPPRVHMSGPLRPGAIELTAAQSKRLLGAHRLREGSEFLAFSGDGKEWTARVVSATRSRGSAEILEVIREEPPQALALEVLCGLIRPSRFEWAIEKCVEAGADVIRPLISENSARGSAPSAQRLERWERIVLEAAEQSGRLHLPALGRPARFEAVAGGQGGTLLVCDRGGTPWPEAEPILPAAGTLKVLVGPEGGLTEDELVRARAGGALTASLGPHVMRTETAAVAAAVLVRSRAKAGRS